MQIKPDHIDFGKKSGSGPQTATKTVTMDAPVTKAIAILTGFNVEYSNNDDHHLGLLEVQVSVPPGGVTGSDVTVNVSYGLRDWSDSWDDVYDGHVYFTVIGE